MPLTPRSRHAFAIGAALMLTAPASLAQSDANRPDTAPPADDTRSLIPDESLAGWHADVPEADADPGIAPSFSVRDGMLLSHGTPLGHLITDEPFADYRLDVEYRFADKPGNCGVLVHASTSRALYDMFPQSIEVQMFSGNAGDFWCIEENIAVDNMADRRSGEPETWGGSEGDSRRILNLTDDSENPVGDWNRMVIECFENRVRVWVNGDLVNDGSSCTARKGSIAVQAEGTPVEFRRFDYTPIRGLTPAENQEDWVVEETRDTPPTEPAKPGHD